MGTMGVPGDMGTMGESGSAGLHCWDLDQDHQCDTAEDVDQSGACDPGDCLGDFWDDLRDFGGGEFMEYTTMGTAPGRVFHLFVRARLFSSICGTDAIQFMISVHETSNLVKVVYSGFSGCANMRGASATLGFQAPGGGSARAVMVGLNVPLLDDNLSFQSMSFQPPTP